VTRFAGRRARVAAGVLLALWCAAIWMLSDRPDPESLVGFDVPLWDKLQHGLAYAVGGFLAACLATSDRRGRAMFAGVAFCALWGALDEVHQSWVPDRDSSGLDVVADVIGGAAGAAALTWAAGRGASAASAALVSSGEARRRP
jgi:VanZ family protein